MSPVHECPHFPGASAHRLIRSCPEICEHSRWYGRVHHPLRKQNSNEAFGWINVRDRAKAAGPTESTWIVVDLATRGVDREPQAPTAVGAEEDVCADALLGCELI